MPTPQPSAPPPAWGAVPLVPIALATILGVLVADALGNTPPLVWLSVAAGISITGGVLLLRPAPQRWRSVLSSGLILVLAFVLAGWRNNATYLPQRTDFFMHHFQEGDLLAGTVSSLRPGDTRMRTEVTLTHLLRDTLAEQVISGKILLYLPPDEATAKLRSGDGIVFRGRPRDLRPPLNPYVFDFRNYWSRKGIYHNAYLKTAQDWELATKASAGIKPLAEAFRRSWFNTLQRHLSGDQLAVAAALVMGQRDGLSSEIKSAYAETGAIHVLAVSGLHVGIIFLILRFLLVRILRLDRTLIGRWSVALLSIVLIWGFALVSGMSASVQRAALMFTVLALGGVTYRKTDVFNVLAATSIIMLWWNPQQLFHVGFQLSFTAIIGIVLFTNHLNRLISFPWRLFQSAWSAMAASTGAQLGTLPLSLYHFGQFPSYFLVSGTVVILSAFATMVGGLLLGFLGGVIPRSGLTALCGSLLGGIVYLQNAFIFWFQGLPGGLLQVSVFPWYSAVLLAAGILALAAWVRWRKLWLGGIGLLFCVLVVIMAGTQAQQEATKAGAVIYHVSRGTLLDVHDATRAYSFGATPANLTFTAAPYRARHKLHPLSTKPFTAPDTVYSPSLHWQAPVLTVGDERWLVLSGEGPTPDITAISGLDLILVTDGLQARALPELPPGSSPLLVIDGSIPPYHNTAWRAEAERRGIPIWVTGEDGAYVVEW